MIVDGSRKCGRISTICTLWPETRTSKYTWKRIWTSGLLASRKFEAARSIFFASNSLNAMQILYGNAHITPASMRGYEMKAKPQCSRRRRAWPCYKPLTKHQGHPELPGELCLFAWRFADKYTLRNQELPVMPFQCHQLQWQSGPIPLGTAFRCKDQRISAIA